MHASQVRLPSVSGLYSQAMDAWAYGRHVKFDFIRPGHPMESGHNEHLGRPTGYRVTTGLDPRQVRRGPMSVAC